jgi:5-methylcytosine-specific restriction enzyme A
MGYNFPKPCLDCGLLTRNGNRCEVHQARVDALHEARRASVKKVTGQYGNGYSKRAKEVREAAVTCHLCGEGARWGDPWEADHLYPAEPDSPLLPAHRSCNISRGNKSV